MFSCAYAPVLGIFLAFSQLSSLMPFKFWVSSKVFRSQWYLLFSYKQCNFLQNLFMLFCICTFFAHFVYFHPRVISTLWSFNAPVNKIYRTSPVTTKLTGSPFINLRRFSALVVGRIRDYCKCNRSLYGTVPRWQYHDILKPEVQISKEF